MSLFYLCINMDSLEKLVKYATIKKKNILNIIRRIGSKENKNLLKTIIEMIR